MTAQSKSFTPGPWTYESGELYTVVIAPHNRVICSFHNNGRRFDHHQANARLIAAAPEMYEALMQLHKALPAIANSSSRKTSSAIYSLLDRVGLFGLLEKAGGSK